MANKPKTTPPKTTPPETTPPETTPPETTPPETGEDAEIDRPRLTPQGRDADGAEDETDPQGGVKKGQGDKAEG